MISVPLPDGGQIHLTLHDVTLDIVQMWPHNTLKLHAMTYDTPSGQAVVTLAAKYIPPLPTPFVPPTIGPAPFGARGFGGTT